MLRWLVAWSDLVAGLVGVLTLGFLDCSPLQVRAQDAFLCCAERVATCEDGDHGGDADEPA